MTYQPKPHDEQNYYESIYYTLNPQNETSLNQASVGQLLKASKLDQDILRQIWSIAMDGKRAVTKAELFLILRGISVAQTYRVKNISRELILSTVSEDLPQPTFEGFQIKSRPEPEKAHAQKTEAPPLDDKSWGVTAAQKKQYSDIFARQPLHDGRLNGGDAAVLFQQSGVPTTELREIWNLSDVDKDGFLTLTEFIIAMHLTMCVKRRNWAVPDSLPTELAMLFATAHPPSEMPPMSIQRPLSAQSNNGMIPDASTTPPPGSARHLDGSSRHLDGGGSQRNMVTMDATNGAAAIAAAASTDAPPRSDLDPAIEGLQTGNAQLGVSTYMLQATHEQLEAENNTKMALLLSLQQEQGRLTATLSELVDKIGIAESMSVNLTRDIEMATVAIAALNTEIFEASNRFAALHEQHVAETAAAVAALSLKNAENEAAVKDLGCAPAAVEKPVEIANSEKPRASSPEPVAEPESEQPKVSKPVETDKVSESTPEPVVVVESTPSPEPVVRDVPPPITTTTTAAAIVENSESNPIASPAEHAPIKSPIIDWGDSKPVPPAIQPPSETAPPVAASPTSSPAAERKQSVNGPPKRAPPTLASPTPASGNESQPAPAAVPSHDGPRRRPPPMKSTAASSNTSSEKLEVKPAAGESVSEGAPCLNFDDVYNGSGSS